MPQLPLTPAQTERSMVLSIFEGSLFAIMVGFGDAFFLADAVRLGASPLQQGLVITLPLLLGGIGSVLALRLLARAPARKQVVLVGVALQVLVLSALAALQANQLVTPALLILLVSLHQAGGQCAGTAWSSWYGDLVPGAVRGRYFARRSRYVYLATCFGLVTSGLLLQGLEPGAPGSVAAGAGGRGFVLIFAIAATARLASFVLLALSPEPRFRGLPDRAWTRRYLRTTKGRSVLRLLLLGAAVQLGVYVGSPYFGPFMLEGLHFTYAEYMAASIAVVLAKVAVLPLWGRAVDAHGARSIYLFAALLVALVPLPWLVTHGLGMAVFAQALSGFCWGAYEVSFFALVLEVTYRATRPYVFAAQNLLQGSMQLVGGLVGATLLGWLGRSFLAIFLISAAARALVALAAPRVLPRLAFQPQIGHRALLLRVIGIRPHGGLTHRPIEAAREP